MHQKISCQTCQFDMMVFSSTPMTTSQLFPQKNIQHVYFPKTSLNPTPTNPQRKSSNEVNSSKTNPNIPGNHPKTQAFPSNIQIRPTRPSRGLDSVRGKNSFRWPTSQGNTKTTWHLMKSRDQWSLEFSEEVIFCYIMQRRIGATNHQTVNSDTVLCDSFLDNQVG